MAILKGFFTEEDLDVVSLNGINSNCESCGLSQGGCKTPQMGYVGNGKKEILIVAEAPSEAEDMSGAPMTGDTGKWFKEKLSHLGINLDLDCWKTNAVGCHPTKQKDRKPTKAQVKYCHPRLMKTIEELKPKFIWLMGTDAVHSYYHKRENDTGIERWRGLCIPDPDKKAWIIPLYHPAYALKMEKDSHFQKTYDRDLDHAVRCSRQWEEPEHMPLKKVTILKKYNDVIFELEKILKLVPDKFTFDYETTGLKPYRADHRIATISYCYDYDQAFTFPYQYNNHFNKDQIRKIGDLWCDILLHPKIKKIAQNLKYEDAWTRQIFGIDIENMWWCTMNASHILDSRSKFTGLKFQALIRWGIPDYDSQIEKYLKSVDKSPYNRVMQAPLNDLLLYGGIDSLLTFRLQEEQEYELTIPGMQNARKFIQEGIHTFCDLQENGIPMNRQYYLDQNVLIGKRIVDMTTNLHKFPEAQKFLKVKGREINFQSSTDLGELFFKILGLEAGKKTAGGNNCVDASVLVTLNTPIAKEITKISKLEKIKGTYLGQFIREIDDDEKLHPFFDLHTTNTNRGSSSVPNFQNIPIHDEESMLITRGGIIPTLGNCLVDWDYSSMEVRIIACITQDPVLIKYIEDSTTDMHRDQAMELFSFTTKEWDYMVSLDKKNGVKNAKNIRYVAKNGMVFALFYGSFFKSVARGVFASIKELKTGEMSLFEHLRNKGVIRSLSTAYQDFEDHVKKTEKKFWLRFKGVKAWQERAFKEYLEKGYIEQLFGFRIGGWLTKNDICNYPVQGTAFHCLVWALNQLNQRMKDAAMESLLIGQIHDCCLGDINPEEEKSWCQMSYSIATKEIRKAFPWIIVPLDIEFEKGKINEPWSMKKEFFPEL